MNARRCKRLIGPALALTFMGLVGCVATVGYDGYDGSDNAFGYGGGLYAPYGYSYGGWGPGYHVGPPRGGERRGERAGSPYHSRMPSRPSPSIPTRVRRR